MPTPYEILGVSPDADSAAVLAAYRRRAKRLHPDAGGSPEGFAALGEAFRQASAPRSLPPPRAAIRHRSGPVRLNTAIALGLAGTGLVAWLYGDGAKAYDGRLVAIGWALLILALGVWIERKGPLTSPWGAARRGVLTSAGFVARLVFRLAVMTALILGVVWVLGMLGTVAA